jgi:hypothetical protein
MNNSELQIEINTKVGKDFGQTFDMMIKENGGLDKIKEIQPVMDWYDTHKPVFGNFSQDKLGEIHDAANILNLTYESRKSRDAFLSKLLNIVVEKAMGQVSVPFVSMMINEIKLKTEGKTKSGTFAVSFTRTVLKPYVEFILRIDGIEKSRTKIRFMIDIISSMKDIKLEYSKDSSLFALGMLEVTLVAFVKFKIPVTGIIEQKQLGKKLFKIDLSKYHVSTKSEDSFH